MQSLLYSIMKLYKSLAQFSNKDYNRNEKVHYPIKSPSIISMKHRGIEKWIKKSIIHGGKENG